MSVFKGKVAVITGSSMGIGKALAFEMAKRGAKIVLNGRNECRLNATFHYLLNEGYDVRSVVCDVSKFEDCERLVRDAIQFFGKIDFLINNAGLAAEGEIEKTDKDVIKKIVEVNFLGCVYLTKLALPHIKKQQGSILFISSLAGIHGLPNYSMYSSSKMALTAFAQSIKIELSQTGVHVGIAYLGFTENDPQKTIYNEKGELKAIPKRKGSKIDTVEQVSFKLCNMIEKRTYKSTFSILGRILSFFNKISPFIIEKILTYSYKKQLIEKNNL